MMPVEIPDIHILIPVHNRIKFTKSILEQLSNQNFKENFRVIFIDAGSKDGTTEFLINKEREKSIAHLILGNADWWWAKCIHEGISFLINNVKPNSLFILLNDDVTIGSNYVQDLYESHREAGNVNAIICSSLFSIDDQKITLIENNYSIDLESMKIFPRVVPSRNNLVNTQACTGRGVLYPAQLFFDGLVLNYLKLPQHLCDLDLSIRGSELGAPIYYSMRAKVISSSDFGSTVLADTLFQRLFSVRSGEYIFSHYFFWRARYKSNNILIFTYLFFITLLRRKIHVKY